MRFDTHSRVCVTRRWQQQTQTRSRATLRPTHARVKLNERGVRPRAAIYQPVVSRRASYFERDRQDRAAGGAPQIRRGIKGADAQQFARAAA